MNWEMIIISILGSVVTGAFTILAVIITERINYKKFKKEADERRQEKYLQLLSSRPEFEITNYKLFETEYIPEHSNDYLIDTIVVSAEHNLQFGKGEYCVVEYDLKNIGKQLIEYVDFVILRKGWGLILNDDNKSDGVGVVKVCASNHFVKIKNGETVKIRVCFLKNELPYNFMSAFACLLYQSFDKECWKQLLLIPECKTESSFHIDYTYYCTHFR